MDEWVDALRAPAGQAVLRRAAALPLTDASLLSDLATLRREQPDELVTAAVRLTRLRRRGRAKFSRADVMWLTRPGLEQASSELVARHRAQRYASAGAVADLCCGIGGDLVALAERTTVLGVDRDPLHVRLARLNAEACGASEGVEVRCDDVTATTLRGCPAVFVDPARRRDGRRLPAGSSDPPLKWCLDLIERVPAVGVKCAPGIDRALVPAAWELECVAVGRELKEARLWSPALADGPRRATVLPGGESLTPVPGERVGVAPPGAYVVDPSPAVTRSGLVQDLARQLGAWQLDPELAMLSVATPVATPFGRTLRVLDSLPWSLKALRRSLRRLDIGTVDVRKRGSAVDVDALRHRLALEGSLQATVVLTRLTGRPWALVGADVA
ncbi:MAG: class I SAM-dependent methyltransferase [Egibacteraceae bacterium]